MVFKIKDESGYYNNKALHFAIGINLEGKKELLGMWIENNEAFPKNYKNFQDYFLYKGLNKLLWAI